MSIARFPAHGYIGLILIAIGWPLAWAKPNGMQFLWENAFLSLWVGYCFFVDGLNFKIKGNSLFARNRMAFAGLFILSIPGWWLFEFFNIFLQNWHYILIRPFAPFEYFIRSSIHFSIVTPAVLATAELWSSAKWILALENKKKLTVNNSLVSYLILLGVIFLTLVVGFPQYAFPLVWVSLVLIFDPINWLRQQPSVLQALEKGNWKPLASLPLGALTCGFFWEMWNYYSLPKWEYSIPFVDVLHIFEMPLPGYLGYLPFGIEVFALYILLIDKLGLKNTFINGGFNYIQI